jgi:two-component system sensor histidine kinase CpxA
MKPSKIYIKIFISFLMILIVTEILIFGLFIIYPGRNFRAGIEQYAKAVVTMVRESIEDKIRTAPDVDPSRNDSLKEFIRNLGQLLNAKIWLQDAGGGALVKSFPGNPPAEPDELEAEHEKDLGSFKFYHGHGRSSALYAVIPIDLQQGKSASLHVLFAKTGPLYPEKDFAAGLGIIGLVIALLVMPVSRYISKPINQLRRSAERIAEGELSHRVMLKRKDEIGKLGRAFNHMADRLEKMIRGGKELTAHISHELRTPLTRIRIAEEMLRERLEQQNDAGLVRYLDDIREDIEELDDLIGRILTLSKLDLKETPLSLKPVNPADLVNELLSRLKPAMDKKGLQLGTDICFEPPLLGDRDALQTAFSNILENAVKYSPSAGRMEVDIKSVENAMEVTVTNTADRIPEKDLEKIFEPFHRSGTKGEPGFGLGLAIVRKIIETHGGKIRAQNTEEGFRIKIRLPRNPAEEGA